MSPVRSEDLADAYGDPVAMWRGFGSALSLPYRTQDGGQFTLHGWGQTHEEAEQFLADELEKLAAAVEAGRALLAEAAE
jgi:hypothetical protein